MSSQDQEMSCAEIAELVVFYACDEVSEQERAAIERHLAMCPSCQALLSEEREFLSALSSLPRADEQLDPSGILLSQCRSDLSEKLDDFGHPRAKEKASTFAFLRRWMALHPAWSAATLILLGLVAGVESAQWFTGQNNAVAVDPVSVHPSPRITEEQLSKMAVAGINFAPSPNPDTRNVRVQLSAEQPVELTGSLDDSDVRNVLTYVVKNGERFDSGVRLDCLDALRARAEDSEVRSALLCAARRDQNPAVRLKALEALRGSASDDVVREALLQALKHDVNPGVRVEAVNLLVRSLESAPHDLAAPMPPPDVPVMAHGNVVQAGAGVTANDGSVAGVIRALEDLQRNDPSRYVRLRSAAALREISARNDQ